MKALMKCLFLSPHMRLLRLLLILSCSCIAATSSVQAAQMDWGNVEDDKSTNFSKAEQENSSDSKIVEFIAEHEDFFSVINGDIADPEKLRQDKPLSGCGPTTIMLLRLMFGRKLGKRIYFGMNSDSYGNSYKTFSDNFDKIMRDNSRHIVVIKLSEKTFEGTRDKKSQFFPGHVFLVEKFMKGKKPHLKIYQSYLNQYTLGEFYKYASSFEWLSATQLNNILQLLTSSTIWTVKTAKAYDDLTFVKTQQLIGLSCGKLYFRFSIKKLEGNDIYKNAMKWFESTSSVIYMKNKHFLQKEKILKNFEQVIIS